MDTWQFYQNDAGEWCWKHVAATGVTTQGEHCYMSRTDCIADAMRNGYLARPPSRLPARQRGVASCRGCERTGAIDGGSVRSEVLMTTKLDGTLKREIQVGANAYTLTITPVGLKLVLKGRRKGQEISWDAIVSGDAALAKALTASLSEERS